MQPLPPRRLRSLSRHLQHRLLRLRHRLLHRSIRHRTAQSTISSVPPMPLLLRLLPITLTLSRLLMHTLPRFVVLASACALASSPL